MENSSWKIDWIVDSGGKLYVLCLIQFWIRIRLNEFERFLKLVYIVCTTNVDTCFHDTSQITNILLVKRKQKKT